MVNRAVVICTNSTPFDFVPRLVLELLKRHVDVCLVVSNRLKIALAEAVGREGRQWKTFQSLGGAAKTLCEEDLSRDPTLVSDLLAWAGFLVVMNLTHQDAGRVMTGLPCPGLLGLVAAGARTDLPMLICFGQNSEDSPLQFSQLTTRLGKAGWTVLNPLVTSEPQRALGGRGPPLAKVARHIARTAVDTLGKAQPVGVEHKAPSALWLIGTAAVGLWVGQLLAQACGSFLDRLTR